MEASLSKEEKKFPMSTGASINKMKSASGFDVEEQLENVKDKSKEYYHRTESVIKDHPFYAVMGAATIGYLASFIFNRKH
jgi:ElaB/YqjD/DUF883 family membrane-anchored ribosome-binding protein